MPISTIDLKSLTNEQLKTLIDEDPSQQVECPIEKRHIVKIEQIEAHISECLRGNVHLGYKQCPNCSWHILGSALELEQHQKACLVGKPIPPKNRENAINELFGQIF